MAEWFGVLKSTLASCEFDDACLTLSLPAYHCRQWKSWHIYASPVGKGLISLFCNLRKYRCQSFFRYLLTSFEHWFFKNLFFPCRAFSLHLPFSNFFVEIMHLCCMLSRKKLLKNLLGLEELYLNNSTIPVSRDEISQVLENVWLVLYLHISSKVISCANLEFKLFWFKKNFAYFKDEREVERIQEEDQLEGEEAGENPPREEEMDTPQPNREQLIERYHVNFYKLI